MRIDSSIIGTESARSYTSLQTRSLKFSISNGLWSFGNQDTIGNGENASKEAAGKKDSSPKTTDGVGGMTERLKEIRAKLNMSPSRVQLYSGGANSREQMNQMMTIRQQGIQFLFQALFSNGLRRQSFGTDGTSGTGQADPIASGMMMTAPANANVYTFEQVYNYSESELTTFTTQGKVKCADGREIDFNLNLQMSRSFEAYYKEEFQMAVPNFCDPLVINLEGNITELSDQTFLFDIDGDGTQDNISRLASGSGYLALDQNGDGVINDGKELFGTSSGNGFRDLAKYDADGNGWIDEGDPIWEKLKIWVMDENGEGQLYSLAEKGLGAICLSHSGTEFTLTNDNNEAKGVVRQSGMFLYESGAVGSVQQVDLVKYDQVS